MCLGLVGLCLQDYGLGLCRGLYIGPKTEPPPPFNRIFSPLAIHQYLLLPLNFFPFCILFTLLFSIFLSYCLFLPFFYIFPFIFPLLIFSPRWHPPNHLPWEGGIICSLLSSWLAVALVAMFLYLNRYGVYLYFAWHSFCDRIPWWGSGGGPRHFCSSRQTVGRWLTFISNRVAQFMLANQQILYTFAKGVVAKI